MDQKKNRNDKYSFYFPYNPDLGESVYHDEELISQARYFDIKEEEFFNKGLATVKGNLKRNISFWEEIGSSAYIIDVIKNGYKIPFYETPDRSFHKNNMSAIQNARFVKEAVSELVNQGCVICVPFQPHVVNPLSVSINNQGKKRLILDLRIPNKSIWKERIKFEDWKTALDYFEKGSFLYKFDLRSGYFHIDISSEFQTFLGFQFEEKFYTYTVLPFGLSSAPYIFTKCLRSMIKFWRKNCIKIVVFLDDGLGMNSELSKTIKDSNFVKQSLLKAGFVINMENPFGTLNSR